MLRQFLFSFLLVNSALAEHYEFSLNPVPEELSDPFFVPEGHIGYDLGVSVPFGLMGVILSYDPENPAEISLSAVAPFIAQGYRFFAVDAPDSPAKTQIASNYGDWESNAPFTMTSGQSQYLTFEEEGGQTGWVLLGYHQNTGLRIISQSPISPPPWEPGIYIRNGRMTISPSDLGIIQQSNDLKNWTNITTVPGVSVTLLLSENKGPLYFRELCP